MSLGTEDANARDTMKTFPLLLCLSLLLGGCVAGADDVRFAAIDAKPNSDVWPSCEEAPGGMSRQRVSDVWAEDPSEPMAVWLEAVVVSAVSRGRCTAGEACLLFVQQSPSFASFDAAIGQSLRLVVSADVSDLFVGIAAGDRINLLASAWRPATHANNELFLAIDTERPGCAKVVGKAELTPLNMTLADLSVTAYEDLVGPLLVTVQDVAGVPKAAYKTFSLKPQEDDTPQAFDEMTSVSPYLMPGGHFVGLEHGESYDFDSVTGVFALFTPDGAARKYEHIYPRHMGDLNY
jgi:hypothetical protein